MLLLVLALQLVAEGYAAITMIRLNMLPDLYVLLLVGVLALLTLLVAGLMFLGHRKRVRVVRRWVACILAVLIAAGCLLVGQLATDAFRAVHTVTNHVTTTTRNMYVFVRYEDPAAYLADAKDYTDLKYMSFLETLNVEKGVSNQINHISNLVNLTDLSISDTNVSQEDLGIISVLPKLKKLTLQKCSLSGITPLQKASGLEMLDVSDNSALRNIDALRSLGNLLELNLSGNAVSDLSAISSLTNLTKLDISKNSVASLAPISTLSRLSYLDASANLITALGDLGNLTALNFLNLSSNKLTNINVVAGCTALTELNISTNSLTNISKLNSLVNLTSLDFSYNQVTKIPEFPKKCALVTISGSNNKITSLEPLSGLKSLNIVNMDYNEGISSVKPLANCPVLIEVNVFATKVTQVTVLTDQSIIVNYNPVS